MRGGASTRSALALAELCYRTLLADGTPAVGALQRREPDEALERLVEANTLLSGLGFESSGLAAAHAIHNGLTTAPGTHAYMHGEKVAFGLLAQLMLEGQPESVVKEVLAFSSSVGLPTTFADVEDVLAWGLAQLPERGVDVGRLALSGHSAGAILTAHLAVRDDWLVQRALPTDLIKAAIPISGVYDFTDLARPREFFSSDADRSASSPLHIMAITPPPMLIAYGSDENDGQYASDSERLAEAIQARGGQATAQELKGMTHADTADAVGDATSPLFASVVALLAEAGVASTKVAV